MSLVATYIFFFRGIFFRIKFSLTIFFSFFKIELNLHFSKCLHIYLYLWALLYKNKAWSTFFYVPILWPKEKETRPVFVFNKKGRAFRQHLNPLIKMLKHFQNFVHVLKKLIAFVLTNGHTWTRMNLKCLKRDNSRTYVLLFFLICRSELSKTNIWESNHFCKQKNW